MPNKVFFSWQSDVDSAFNKNFIRGTIKITLKQLNKTTWEFYYDESTRNQIGSIDITESLFQKIKSSTVFIADVTTINSSENTKRKCPNPNVLLELGYAAGILGWDNIILLFNSAFGDLQDIPFDLRNRRIVTYNLEDKSTINSEKKKLQDIFTDAFKQMDIGAVQERDYIQRAFYNQSERVKFYALQNGDEYWNTKLLSELLNGVLERLNFEYDLIINEIEFVDRTTLNPSEYLDFLAHTVHFQGQLTRSLASIYESRIVDILNNKKPVEILRLSQTIERISNKLLQMELKKRSISIAAELEDSKKYLGINMEAYINFIRRLNSIIGSLHSDQREPPINKLDLEPIFNFEIPNFQELYEKVQKLR